MLVCMLTWGELEAGEMNLYPLPTCLFFYYMVAFLVEDTREKIKVSLVAKKNIEPVLDLCVSFAYNFPTFC